MTDDLWWPPNPIQSCKASAEWTKQASEAWWAIKDKSGQKDENTELTPTINYQDRKKGGMGKGVGAVSSRSFDLLNSMIYDLKRSVDLRWLFDPVLHSSLDDLVCICIFQDIISAPPISWMTEDQTCDRPICTDSVRANKAQDLHPEGEMHRNVFLIIESINSWHWAKRDTSLEV